MPTSFVYFTIYFYVRVNVLGLGVYIKIISEIWCNHDWQCSNYKLQLQTWKLVGYYWYPGTPSCPCTVAAESFKKLVNINQTGRRQIFKYQSVSSQNKTNNSCYFLGEVFITASGTEADRCSFWSVQWNGETNISLGTRGNKNNGAETEERNSGRSMTREWLLYNSCIVTRTEFHIAQCFVSGCYMVQVLLLRHNICRAILCEWLLYCSCVVIVIQLHVA
jgi:hypothetical protein